MVRAIQVRDGLSPDGFTCNGDIACANTTPYFSDVPTSDAYFKYVQKLHELGITAAAVGGAYNDSAYVTRDMMAAFMSRSFLGTNVVALSSGSSQEYAVPSGSCPSG